MFLYESSFIMTFYNNKLQFALYDTLNAGVIALSGSVKATDCLSAFLEYEATIGNLKAHVNRFPSNDTIFYYFPLIYVSTLKIGASLEI